MSLVSLIAFLIFTFIFPISAKAPKELGQIANVSVDQFNNFQGETDPCDSTDQNYHKQICNKVAILINQIESGSLTFLDGAPLCMDVKVELQSGKGSTQFTTLLLFCAAKEYDFLIGRGQSKNGVYGWSREDSIAYPQMDVPNVFKAKDEVA